MSQTTSWPCRAAQNQGRTQQEASSTNAQSFINLTDLACVMRRIMRRRMKLGKGEESDARSGDDTNSGNEERVKEAQRKRSDKRKARTDLTSLMAGDGSMSIFRRFQIMQAALRMQEQEGYSDSEDEY